MRFASGVLVFSRRILIAVAFLFFTQSSLFAAGENSNAYGIKSRPDSKPYLLMPDRADGSLPRLLSQTGAFKETTNLGPSTVLIPYDLIVPFWSDGATKSRWVSVPDGQKIKFTPTGEWTFPHGTVFVKTFSLATNELNLNSLRRLETRLLVCDAAGGVYGVTYKWRADDSDADLLETNLTETIPIQTASGVRTQQWYYPSRADCLTCHTPLAGYVLGVKTRQLNRDFTYPSGITDNELRTWDHIGLFNTNLTEAEIENFPKLARLDDTTQSLETRARSYLDVNCANCHRPGGTVAYFDARFDTPLVEQGLVGGRILIDQRIDGARVIAPNDIWRSILYMRANTAEAFKMPPLTRNTIDEPGMKLLRQWIESPARPDGFARHRKFRRAVEIFPSRCP
ncbi:MAG: hypothetical protein WDN00_04725 [Limisphaerales bacterium]